jgi:hypothetical protein
MNHQPDVTIFQFIIIFGLKKGALHTELSLAGRLTVYTNQPARPRTQHDYLHDTKVKPEAATAVSELLMMGGKTPETC